MHDEPTQSDARQSGGPQFPEAFDRLVQIVLDGLRHGHFRCAISSCIGKGNRRELVIEAGKSHKFNIPEEELPRSRGTESGDPCDGDARDANHVRVQRHRWDSETGGQEHGAARNRP
jgi:hypothetical protein